jgi:hypothetical protein
MKTTLPALLAKAANAAPPQKESRSSWVSYSQVVNQLVVNGYTVLGAVDWLIAEGEIPVKKRRQAYRALLFIRERQAAKAAAEAAKLNAANLRAP